MPLCLDTRVLEAALQETSNQVKLVLFKIAHLHKRLLMTDMFFCE